MNKPKRWIRSNVVRWTAREPIGWDSYGLIDGDGNPGIVASTVDGILYDVRGRQYAGARSVVVNAGTPEWLFMDRKGVRALGEACLRCANDKKFWAGKVK